MNRWLAILAVMAVFLVGTLAGVLGTHIYYSKALRRPGAPPFMASRFFAERLERRLELGADQMAEIEAILERTREESESMRREMKPRVEDLLARTMEEITTVLTPGQRAEFERMRREQRRRMEQFLLKPPGPRGSRPHHPPRERPGERDRDQRPDRSPDAG